MHWVALEKLSLCMIRVFEAFNNLRISNSLCPFSQAFLLCIAPIKSTSNQQTKYANPAGNCRHHPRPQKSFDSCCPQSSLVLILTSSRPKHVPLDRGTRQPTEGLRGQPPGGGLRQTAPSRRKELLDLHCNPFQTGVERLCNL